MLRLMATKVGMTTIFDTNGMSIPVTVLRMEPNKVLSVQPFGTEKQVFLGVGAIKAAKVNKAEAGHFKKLGAEPVLRKATSRVSGGEAVEAGQSIGVEFFENVKFVDVQSETIGKGFQGVMKKLGYAGGPGGHGSNFHRRLGSAGSNTYPAKVWKGKGMPGRMGGATRTMLNLKVVSADKENQLLLVKGNVPGHNHCEVLIRKAVKKPA